MKGTWLDPEHPVSRKSLELVRDLIEERLGVYFSEQNLPTLADRLGPRAQELGMSSYLDYYYHLKYDPQGLDEWPAVASAVTVNETYFWREPEAIRLVARSLVTEFQDLRQYRPVRIWHAACATGEEPYSLAMALDEAGRFARGAIELLASDLDQVVLARARRGIYGERALRFLPPEFRERYLRPVERPGSYEVVPELRSRVEFRVLNLAEEGAVSALNTVDIIFCRNVLIYFRESLSARLGATFQRLLSSPGYLFLGSSESLLRYALDLEFIQREGVLAYRKNGPV